MKQNKKEILLEQVQKIEEVLETFKANFECEEELCNEYSFLAISKKNLNQFAEKE